MQLVFHHLCKGCNAHAVAQEDFDALLAWLGPRAANGTIVQTTAEVIGGSALPPVQP